MTESETAAAVTREPSRFPAADATADVRRLAPGVGAGMPTAEAAAGTVTGAEVDATAVSGSGCDRSRDYGWGCGRGCGLGRGCGCGGETVALPRRRLPEAAHTLASSRAVAGASSR